MAGRHAPLLLLIDPERWRLYDPTALEAPVAELTQSPDLSAELGDLSAQHEWTTRPVVVAIESERCFPCSFEVSSSKHARSRETLRYQIEEALPFSAEQIAADFIVDGLSVFAVCCEREWLSGALATLVEADLQVRCVAPLVLLASSALREELLSSQRKDRDRVNDRVETWLREQTAERLVVRNNKTMSWSFAERDEQALAQIGSLGQLSGERQSERVLVAGPDAPAPIEKEETEDVVFRTQHDPCLCYAASEVGRIGAGTTESVIDFLRDGSIGRQRFKDPLSRERSVLKAAALLLLVAIACWQWMVAQHNLEAIERAEREQADLFREAFPGIRVPRGVRTRLQSELRKIAGTRGGASETPEHRDAVLLLQDLLRELPEDLRYRLLEVRIEPGRFYLVGETRSHSDADIIAAAVRRAGMAVSPPSTQQLAEKGVEFRLSATLDNDPEGGPS